MRNKDLDKKYVREWGSPRSNVQLFVPQEYCGSCTIGYRIITQLSGWSASEHFSYIDLNGDGYYQVGERFNPSTGVSTYPAGISNQHSNGIVGIYYFTMGGGGQNTHALDAGQAYANHTAAGTSYVLMTIGRRNIMIENNTAYYLPDNANHS